MSRRPRCCLPPRGRLALPPPWPERWRPRGALGGRPIPDPPSRRSRPRRASSASWACLPLAPGIDGWLHGPAILRHLPVGGQAPSVEPRSRGRGEASIREPWREQHRGVHLREGIPEDLHARRRGGGCDRADLRSGARSRLRGQRGPQGGTSSVERRIKKLTRESHERSRAFRRAVRLAQRQSDERSGPQTFTILRHIRREDRRYTAWTA